MHINQSIISISISIPSSSTYIRICIRNCIINHNRISSRTCIARDIPSRIHIQRLHR